MWKRIAGGRLVRGTAPSTTSVVPRRAPRRRILPLDYKGSKVEAPSREAVEKCGDILTIILSSLEDRDVIGCVTRISRAWRSAAPLAQCLQIVDQYKFHERCTFFYLRSIAAIRPRITSLRISLTHTEVFVLEWLLRTLDTSCLVSLKIRWTYAGISMLGHLNLPVELYDAPDEPSNMFVHEEATARRLLADVASENLPPQGTQRNIGAFAELCPSLQVLEITQHMMGCAHRTFEGVHRLPFQELLCFRGMASLKSIRMNCLSALQIALAPNIETLVLHGTLANGQTSIAMNFPNLKKIDCSDLSKGLWFRELLCPQLEELVVRLNHLYGSGVEVNLEGLDFKGAELNAVIQSLDSSDLVRRLKYWDNGINGGSWQRVKAQVHPMFKLTVSSAYFI